MILGIGIDSVEIERFDQWHTYTRKQLERILNEGEIDYCLAAPRIRSQRFATRFAAREALYKALGPIFGQQTIPFLTLCKAVTIHRFENGMPELRVNWKQLGVKANSSLESTHIYLSLTHTRTTASAVVIIEKIS